MRGVNYPARTRSAGVGQVMGKKAPKPSSSVKKAKKVSTGGSIKTKGLGLSEGY